MVNCFVICLGIKVKDKWREFNEVCKDYVDDYILVFNDVYFLMVSLGVGDKLVIDKLLILLKEFVKYEKKNLLIFLFFKYS